MSSSPVRRLIIVGIVGAILALLPVTGYAQEAIVSGTVTDSTGGVLPGVTVTALHQESGNTFVAVTDERGNYRLPVRTGIFRLTVELSGFATLVRSLELLVGQQAVVNLQMGPASVQESVTVTGEAPLVDTTKSSLTSNIDPRQMQELPVNGRNWVDLTMLAPGSRQNSASDEPGGGIGNFQLNIDGQRLTQQLASGFGQPKYSRDAIAEFEFVSNRFDASQGGSAGTQVNAITKSGTNTPAGTLSGYFRSDKFNAADFIQNRVLPYSNQQVSATFGGPILRDRVHYFGNYEYEREPQTFSHSSPYPSFNFDLAGTRTEKKGGVRLDFQFSPQTRLSVRGNKFVSWLPYDPRYTGGGSRHPSTSLSTIRHSNDLTAVLTQVLSNRALNEVNVGYAGFFWIQDPILKWPAQCQFVECHPYAGLTSGSPIIQLRGYTIGQAHTNSYQKLEQDSYSVRDNFTFSFTKGGRHDLKVGGEYIHTQNPVFLCNRCMGVLDTTGGPVPANIEQLFPVWNDQSTWNLRALSPIVRFYQLGVGQMQVYAPLTVGAGWVQDDWQISRRLTLNLGLRYDIEAGAFAEDVGLEPFLKAGRPYDKNNFGPRVGFAYTLTDRTVIRGGGGKYFADPGDNTSFWTRLWAGELHPQVLNDGRPDFASNPFNGPVPSYDQVLQTLCSVAPGPNCLRRSITGSFASSDSQIPYSYQTSFGVQRQLGTTISVTADYVYTGSRAGNQSIDVNLAYDPATGANYPFTNISKRPHPDWGELDNRLSEARSNYHALLTSFTKRMSNRWQASVTYLLAAQWNFDRPPIAPGCQYPTTLNAAGKPVCDVPITLAPDIAENRYYLTGDQRNRLTFNGIWQLGYGFQVS